MSTALARFDAAQAVKTIWPTTPVVVGGLTASHFGEEIIAGFPAVDYLIRGDAEAPLRKLAAYCCGSAEIPLATIPNLLYRHNGQVKQTARTFFAGSADLDQLDFVTTHWLHHAESYAALQYSGIGLIRPHDPQRKATGSVLGVGVSSTASTVAAAKRRTPNWRGATAMSCVHPNVVDDVERLAGLGRQQVALSLDPATFGPGWWRPFFGELRRRQVRIGIYNEFFQLPPREFIEALGSTADLAHTEVAISPLSGNEAVRHQHGKHYTNERLLAMLATLKSFEIPIFIYFSLNLPGKPSRPSARRWLSPTRSAKPTPPSCCGCSTHATRSTLSRP